MSDKQLMYCIIAFILGWLVSTNMGDGFCISAQINDQNSVKLNQSYKKQARDTYECNDKSPLQFKINNENKSDNFIEFISDGGEGGYLTCLNGNTPKQKSMITQTMKIGANAINDGKSMISGFVQDVNNLE